MRVRSILAGLATTAVVVSVGTLTGVSPAAADPSYGEPDANDLVGVGSDTTENAMDNLSNGITGIPGYNDGRTGADPLLASWLTEGGQISLRSGSPLIDRPVGSTAGKALLYAPGNNPDVSYARSSSALSQTEISGGVKAFPFALDTLAVGVSGTVASHAPAALTGAQILSIYKGDVTNWNQLPGGTAGTIQAYLPQAGSGTRSFFDAQLKALNGGNTVSYAASVNQSMHENTDDVLKNDANAIAPFSVGKQQTLYPTSVHIESTDNANGGWSVQRALYNMVRGTDLADATLGPRLQAVFGEDGFICSTAARGLIEAAGFQQLATPANGGACGQLTTDPTSNFAVNAHVATTTLLKFKSSTAKHADLTAKVTGSTAPNGTVDFFEGATLLQADVPLTSGQAKLSVKSSPGNHTYTARFKPSLDSTTDASHDNVTGFVTAPSTVTESFPAKVAHGDRAKGTVTVTLTGIPNQATGTVKVLKGTKTLVKGTLAKGKVTLKLPKLAAGKNHLKATWAGDKHGAGSGVKFTITQK
jgi:ABC-type phosphate transport system substrate-binding protein